MFTTRALRAAMCCALVPTTVICAGADAPQDPSAQDPTDVRLLEERLEALEERHRADQQRIDALEQRLLESGAAGHDPWLEQQRAAQRRALVDGVLDDAAARPDPSPWARSNLLNPQITVFVDMGASLSTNDDNEASSRFNLREAEVDLRSAITPYADGVFVIAIGEEIESSVDGIEIETAFEIEEGYVEFHTFLHDVHFRAGKFRNAFGRNNRLHTHDLPQITRPLAVTAFLGPEGLATVGASASWLVPNPWDRSVELTLEVVNADGGEESPILAGPDADNPALGAHVKLFEELGETSSLEIGGSWLYARVAEDHRFDAHVLGLDLTWQWRDPAAPDLRSMLVQSELFWAGNDVEGAGGDPSFRNDSFGMYAFVQYQLAERWYAGVRGDYTEFPTSEEFGRGDSQWAVSPYLSFHATDSLRMRVEYQHREWEMGGAWDSEDNILFGLTFSIGAQSLHRHVHERGHGH